MPLAAGARLGPYEILSPLGAGGMGEVYKARDTRLERTVAVKVLPPHLASSVESRQRFEREAKTISQLSHPHICALYDVGREGETEYLVMELLEGETLSDRLARGALPLEQTLRYGTEMADALDKAHRQGIVHRDLKPGNVMLTKSGVKLLDFGLAKVFEPPAAKGSLTALPTKAALTQEGTILGTFQYMAPEQLEGKEADARTDIFAFGCVLFEMATGRKAFSGSSQASLISSIMQNDPPPISSVQPMSPPALDRVVKTCLAKDPEDRWQSASDLKRELRWLAEGSQAGVAGPAPAAPRRKRREMLAWAIAAIGLLAAGALLLSRRSAPVESLVFTLAPPPGLQVRDRGTLALSPDGRRIAFVAQAQGKGPDTLWVRALDSLEMRRIPDTDGAKYPFWSPDGRAIAFFTANRLRRVSPEGGTIQTICDSGSGFGGSWSPTGQILFGSEFGSGIQSVSATGGPVSAMTALDKARGEVTHFFPAFLPDGKHFIFVARNVDPDKTSIMLGAGDAKETRPLLRADSMAVPASPGYLVFAREGALLAQRFDFRRLTVTGEPVPVAPGVRFFTETNQAILSAGGNTLLYGLWPHEKRLVWVDRRGAEVGTLGPVGDYEAVTISPDGRRVAVSERDAARGQNLDIWVFDVGRGTASRVTTERTDDFHPAWFPDGERVLYVSDRAGFYDLYARPVGGGAEQVLLRTTWDKQSADVAPDGHTIAFSGSPVGHGEDLWSLDLAAPGAPKPFVESLQFGENSPRFSPDGRFVAFTSDESGRDEVYVQRFPKGPKHLVSVGGGGEPTWRRDGRELFYVAPDGQLTAAAVTVRGADVETDPPQPLFDLREGGSDAFVRRQYDVSPDGQRFLVVRRVSSQEVNQPVIDVNWFARLGR